MSARMPAAAPKLIRAIRSQASITLTAGGGIRNSGDIQRLGELGVSEVLVASALHNGWLTRDDILRIH